MKSNCTCYRVFFLFTKQGAVLSLPILTKTTLSWLAVHLATNSFRGNNFKQTAIADIFIELRKIGQNEKRKYDGQREWIILFERPM